MCLQTVRSTCGYALTRTPPSQSLPLPGARRTRPGQPLQPLPPPVLTALGMPAQVSPAAALISVAPAAAPVNATPALATLSLGMLALVFAAAAAGSPRTILWRGTSLCTVLILSWGKVDYDTPAYVPAVWWMKTTQGMGKGFQQAMLLCLSPLFSSQLPPTRLAPGHRRVRRLSPAPRLRPGGPRPPQGSSPAPAPYLVHPRKTFQGERTTPPGCAS